MNARDGRTMNSPAFFVLELQKLFLRKYYWLFKYLVVLQTKLAYGFLWVLTEKTVSYTDENFTSADVNKCIEVIKLHILLHA